MNVTKIVTHAGSAHTDDFLAVAALVYWNPKAEVHRREPTKEELEDKSTAVVDIGGVYDLNKNNYDHHHDNTLPCSLVLVLSELVKEPVDELLSIDEIAFVNDWDVLGPVKTQQKWDAKIPLRDLVGEVVVRAFSDSKLILPGSDMHKMLRIIGRQLIYFVMDYFKLINKAHLAEANVFKELVVVRTNENIPIKIIKKVYPDVAIVIQPNQREKGYWSITRVDDHPRVDFNRIKGKIPAKFVHQNGFMCVVEEEYIVPAIELAVS